MSKRAKTWVDVVAPIRQTLDVGAMLKKNVIYPPDGAKALSDLLLKMAAALDQVRVELENQRVVIRKGKT